MKVFVDASAIVAMIAREPEAISFGEFLSGYDERLTGPTSVWEAVRGVESARDVSFAEARQLVADFLVEACMTIVAIGPNEAMMALDAHQCFGKGVHEAKLNFGDCFAYAVAKANGAKILFKGEDFIHTDLSDASLP